MKRFGSFPLAGFVCTLPVLAGDRTPVPPKTGSRESRLLIFPHWTLHGKPGQLPEWVAAAGKLHLEGALPG